MGSKSNFSEMATERYALALFELSKESSLLEEMESQTRSLYILLSTSEEFRSLIKDPTFKKNEQMKSIEIIAKKFEFNETLKKFLLLLCFKRRLLFLEKILNNFLNLLSKSKGEMKAELFSSKELSSDELEKIQRELSENFTSKIKLNYKYDPSLIGGLIIQVGSIMIDTSIKNKLKSLEMNMLEV